MEVFTLDSEARTSYYGISPRTSSGTTPPDKPLSNIEYILTCMGVTIGLGNVWRFPNLAFRNGCGSFVICYAVMLGFVGFPLYYMEVLLGQFTSKGPYFCFSNMAPVTTGVGIAIGLADLCLTLYYTTFIAYTIYYLYVLTWDELPWAKCDKTWGANDRCYSRHNKTDVQKYMACGSNAQDPDDFPLEEDIEIQIHNCQNMTSAGQQFFHRFINIQLREDLSLDEESMSTVNIPLIICLAIAWCIVYLSICKRHEMSFKLLFCIALVPEIILLALFVFVLCIKGGMDGILYYFTPQWKKLLNFKVWMDASVGVFFSLGIGYGYIITFNSTRPFHNDAYRDSVLLTSVDFLTSFVSGCVIFGLAGHLSASSTIPIEYFSDSLFEITFALCPESLSYIQFERVATASFFVLLFSAAVDRQYTQIKALHYSLYEVSSVLAKHRTVTPIVCCFLCFVVNVLFTFEAGLVVIKVIDYYVTGRVILITAVAEMVTVSWIYGTNKFCRDVQFMTQIRPNLYYRVMWGVVAPLVLTVLFVSAWLGLADESIQERRAIYGQIFPQWSFYIGAAIAMVIGIQIPLWAIIVVKYYRRLHITKVAFQPTDQWLPSRERDQQDYLEFVNPQRPKCDSDLDLCSFHATSSDEYGRVYVNTYKYKDRVLIYPNKRNLHIFGSDNIDTNLATD